MESDTTSISFQPLSGAQSNTPFAYLLHVDEFTFLLDCGWTEDFKIEDIKSQIEICSHVNAVLLSHASIEHIGALPYLCKHGLSAPVFATMPIPMLGSLVIYDSYLNIKDEEDFKEFNANDIDEAFQKVNRMTYQQSEQLDGKNITITPHNAGNTLGGTVWRITKGQNEVIYSVSVGDHSKYLSNFAVEQGWHPTLWILDARGPDRHLPGNETQVFRTIRNKIAEGKCVIFPTDGVSGSLEVILTITDFWKKNKLETPIFFVSHSSTAVLKNSQSLSNYLSHELQEKINSENQYPFDFNDFQPFTCLTNIKDLPMDQPCIIIASTDTLMHGYSRRLFIEKALADNLFIFTQREPEGSLAEQLRLDNSHRSIYMDIKQRELLQGEELVKHMEKESLAQEKLLEAQNSDGDVEGNEMSNESDNDVQDVFVETTSSLTLSMKKGFFQFKKPEPKELTDYGCAIVAEKYMKGAMPAAPTKMDSSKMIDSAALQQNFIQEPDFKPSKFTVNGGYYRYLATSIFWNLERSSDYNTIAFNVTSCAPPDIIIIGSTRENCLKLKELINGKLGNTRIKIPAIGEKVSLQRDLTTRKISLSRALLSGIDFVNCGVNDIAYIEATLKADEHQQFVQARPVESSAGHQATFVGSLDMNQLSSKLDSLGIRNEFTGGVLECGGRRVKVRLVNEKSITVEGKICPDYIKVRNAIQDLLKMI